MRGSYKKSVIATLSEIQNYLSPEYIINMVMITSWFAVYLWVWFQKDIVVIMIRDKVGYKKAVEINIEENIDYIRNKKD